MVWGSGGGDLEEDTTDIGRLPIGHLPIGNSQGRSYTILTDGYENKSCLRENWNEVTSHTVIIG